MLLVNDADIITQSNNCFAVYKDSTNSPFTEDKFIKKSFPALLEETHRKYPYTVKIPKSLKDMMAGDFTPAKEFVIEKPFEGPYGPYWFGDSTKGVKFRMGYKNGDSRYICNETLGDVTVHGMLAGATGQGKSVSMNVAIYTMCQEYAPWELKLTLSDAKIVEFKNIAVNNPLPHIVAVAATSDVDYLLSVLETVYKEMRTTNSMFTVASKVFGHAVSNIKDFREVTGLALPRNVLVFDEYQTMFKNAKKLAGKVAEVIDLIARLGRNTGYHLFLGSQEVGSDLPKETMGNISLRCALGCTARVSELLIGNSEAASNLGKKGNLLINTNSEMHNKLDNVFIKVPYITPNNMKEISGYTMQTAKDVDFSQFMRFYDEQAFLYEDAWVQYLRGFPVRKDTIYLGEPSFITEDPEQCIKLKMTGKEIENIAVLTNNLTHLKRLFMMLKYNILRTPGVNNLIMCADRMYIEDCNAKELSEKFFFEEGNAETSTMLQVVDSLIYKRKLCLRADANVFTSPRTEASTDELFYQVFEKGSEFDTVTNRSRCYYYIALINSDVELKSHLNSKADSEVFLKIIQSCLQMCKLYGASDVALTEAKLPPVYAWMLGVNRILGLGRDARQREVDRVKKLLLDCSEVGVRFILFTTTFEELTSWRSAIRWYLLDDTPQTELSKIKCEIYPEQKGPGLAVVFDSLNPINGCSKFKKMFFKDELPPL